MSKLYSTFEMSKLINKPEWKIHRVIKLDKLASEHMPQMVGRGFVWTEVSVEPLKRAIFGLERRMIAYQDWGDN